MQFVSLIENVIVFIQEVIKMMKINKLSAFILAGALTCTAPAMVYAQFFRFSSSFFIKM